MRGQHVSTHDATIEQPREPNSPGNSISLLSGELRYDDCEYRGMR